MKKSDSPKAMARVAYDSETKKLLLTGGSYETEEAAARAYDTMARALYGEDAELNFPEEESPPLVPPELLEQERRLDAIRLKAEHRAEEFLDSISIYEEFCDAEEIPDANRRFIERLAAERVRAERRVKESPDDFTGLAAEFYVNELRSVESELMERPDSEHETLLH